MTRIIPIVKGKKLSKVNHRVTARAVKFFTERDVTIRALAEEVGIHEHTASELVRAFHAVQLCHICGWEKDTFDRDATAIYRFGFGIDVPRRRLTDAQRMARWRAKKNGQDPNLIDHTTPLKRKRRPIHNVAEAMRSFAS